MEQWLCHLIIMTCYLLWLQNSEWAPFFGVLMASFQRYVQAGVGHTCFCNCVEHIWYVDRYLVQIFTDCRLSPRPYLSNTVMLRNVLNPVPACSSKHTERILQSSSEFVLEYSRQTHHRRKKNGQYSAEVKLFKFMRDTVSELESD